MFHIGYSSSILKTINFHLAPRLCENKKIITLAESKGPSPMEADVGFSQSDRYPGIFTQLENQVNSLDKIVNINYI